MKLGILFTMYVNNLTNDLIKSAGLAITYLFMNAGKNEYLIQINCNLFVEKVDRRTKWASTY